VSVSTKAIVNYSVRKEASDEEDLFGAVSPLISITKITNYGKDW
jgi:hypothetical protein